MVARRYSAYGLRILTELEVGVPLEGDGPVDLELAVGPLSHQTTTAPSGRVLAGGARGDDFLTVLVADDRGYNLRVKELADVRISRDVSVVTCHPAPGADADNIRELSATILSFVLPLRRTVALHSSCVLGVAGIEANGAIALVGGSASGKSTLAGRLVAGGAGFVTDDLLPVSVEDGEVRVMGGCLELRLRSTASDLLAAFKDRPVRQTVDERTAVTLGEARQYPIPLGLVLMPELDRAAGTVNVERVAPAAAVVRLLSMGRSGAWVESPEVHGLFFSTMAAIANSVPVLRVRWSPASLDNEALVNAIRGATF